MIGLLTAALVHDLTDAFPRGAWLFVPKGGSPPRSAAFPVQVVQSVPWYLSLKYDDDNGIEARQVHGVTVRLTGLDRTVIDLWRYPRRIPEEFALEALRRRAKLDNFRVPDFARLARRLGAWGRMVLQAGSGGAAADAALSGCATRQRRDRVKKEVRHGPDPAAARAG